MTRTTAIADALAEAARWRLLQVLFERPRAGWPGEMAGLALEAGDRALGAVAATARAEANEGRYLRLLGPGGAASPREAAYAGLGDPGWILADLARVYVAFGYVPRAEDPPDHVSVEAGFVGYLHLKEALALAAADREAAAVTAAARESFLAAHLATIAAPLAARLAAAGPSWLSESARVLAARVPPPATRAAGPSGDPLVDGCGGCGPASPDSRGGSAPAG